MPTPRVLAEFNKNGRHTQIVWAGIGKYEAWTDKRCVQKDMSHEEIIRYLAHCAEDGSPIGTGRRNGGIDTFN